MEFNETGIEKKQGCDAAIDFHKTVRVNFTSAKTERKARNELDSFCEL